MAINATFGTLIYEFNRVTVPITTAENVNWLRPTNFLLEHVSGDDLTTSTLHIEGSGTAYSLIAEIPIGLRGAFTVSPTGKVLKNDLTYDTLQGEDALITYSFIEPVANFIIPPILKAGINIIRYPWNTLVRGLSIDDFGYVGINPGTPQLYRANSLTTEPASTYPINTTDWTLVAAPHTEPAKFHILVFDVPANQLPGTLDLYLKEGAVTSVPTFEAGIVIFGDATTLGTQGVAFTEQYRIFNRGTNTPSISGFPAGTTSSFSNDVLTISFTASAIGNGTGVITVGAVTKNVAWAIEAPTSELITAGGDRWIAGGDRWDFR